MNQLGTVKTFKIKLNQREGLLVEKGLVWSSGEDCPQRVATVLGEPNVLQLFPFIEDCKYSGLGSFWSWWEDKSLQAFQPLRHFPEPVV